MNKRDMSLKAALKEAQRRFGKGANVDRSQCVPHQRDTGPHPRMLVCSNWYEAGHRSCVGGKTVCRVGVLMGPFNMIKAAGSSFRECFEKCDLEVLGDKWRYHASGVVRRECGAEMTRALEQFGIGLVKASRAVREAA